MEFTEQHKKRLLGYYLKNISHIASREYQERVWIRAEGPEVDDFTETVCYFFDLGDPILENYKEYKISEEQYQILLKFRNFFESFVDLDDRPYLEKDFIDTPEWQSVMNRAKEVLQAFHYQEEKEV